MKYHICCNQLEHRWEIINKKNKIIFTGTLEEVEKKIIELT